MHLLCLHFKWYLHAAAHTHTNTHCIQTRATYTHVQSVIISELYAFHMDHSLNTKIYAIKLNRPSLKEIDVSTIKTKNLSMY